MDQELQDRFLMAEQLGHEKHDELVSPRAIPKAREDPRIEVQGPGEEREGREGRDKAETGDEEGKDIGAVGEDSSNLPPQKKKRRCLEQRSCWVVSCWK